MTAKTFELVHASGKEPYTLAFGENLDDPDAPFIAVKLHEDGSATVTQRLQRRDKEADALVDSVVEAVLSGKTGIGPPLTYEQIIEVIERLNVAGGGVGWQMGEEVSAMADTPKNNAAVCRDDYDPFGRDRETRVKQLLHKLLNKEQDSLNRENARGELSDRLYRILSNGVDEAHEWLDGAVEQGKEGARP